jgi:hypothetical protein
MNKGILRATGEYCYFLNSGDCLSTNTILEEIFRINSGEDILCFNVMVESENKAFTVSGPGKSEITFFDILGKWCHQGLLIKYNLFNKFGLYNEDFKISADWVFLLITLGLNNATFRYFDITICRYDGKGISSNSDFWAIERNKAIAKYVPDRVLKDYQTGYFQVLYRLKKSKLSWLLFRILNKIAIFFERRNTTTEKFIETNK